MVTDNFREYVTFASGYLAISFVCHDKRYEVSPLGEVLIKVNQ
jgi:phage-related protein